MQSLQAVTAEPLVTAEDLPEYLSEDLSNHKPFNKWKLGCATIVANRLPFWPKIYTGVYFLLNGNGIVYVGQALNIAARLLFHRTENIKVFDGYFFVECARDDLSNLEAHYIIRLNPLYNFNIPPNEVYKSDKFLKKHFGVRMRQINEFVRKKQIKAYTGNYPGRYFCVQSFYEFGEFLKEQL